MLHMIYLLYSGIILADNLHFGERGNPTMHTSTVLYDNSTSLNMSLQYVL